MTTAYYNYNFDGNDDSDSDDDDYDDYSLDDDASLFTTSTVGGNRNSMYTTTTAIVRAATAPQRDYHGKLALEQRRKEFLFQTTFGDGGNDTTSHNNIATAQRRLKVDRDDDVGADQPLPPSRPRAPAPASTLPAKKKNLGVFSLLDDDIQSSIRHLMSPPSDQQGTAKPSPARQRPGLDDSNKNDRNTTNTNTNNNYLLPISPTATTTTTGRHNSTNNNNHTLSSSSTYSQYNPEASYAVANAHISEWSFRGSAVLRAANRRQSMVKRSGNGNGNTGNNGNNGNGNGTLLYRMSSMDDIGVRYGLGKDYSLFDLHEFHDTTIDDDDNDDDDDDDRNNEDDTQETKNRTKNNNNMNNNAGDDDDDDDDGLLPVAPRELNQLTKIKRRGARLQRAIQGVGLIVTGQFPKKRQQKKKNQNKKNQSNNTEKKPQCLLTKLITK